jgi:hypothetical protein
MLLAAEIRAGAIERIASGGTVLDPEVVAQLLARRHDPPGSLTPREREVVTHMADCCMNAAIETAMLVAQARWRGTLPRSSGNWGTTIRVTTTGRFSRG